MSPVFPGYVRIQQFQAGFVNQRGGAQGVAGALQLHLPVGHDAELLVEHRHEAVKSLPVAAPPIAKQFGNRCFLAGGGLH